MRLLDLPPEILIILPSHLESLQDLHALTLTCRAFSNIPTLISNDLLVRLAPVHIRNYNLTHTYFSPRKHEGWPTGRSRMTHAERSSLKRSKAAVNRFFSWA
ncbi:hypothetical protein FRB95_006077 [Tulasnella sp. JGI-2019a]|nr:hypothetical protein FRB95_006077 [Tulasnella sp. JGI-2019a]